MKTIRFILNGDIVETTIREDAMLIDVLRENFGLTGVKEGCGMGECGACTVIINGKNVNSCLYPAMEVEGKEVITIEGLKSVKSEDFNRIEKAFLENGAVQCGFCTPGMVMSTEAFYCENKDKKEVKEEDIKRALSGNLCRCTGYIQIIEAVKSLWKKN